MRIFTDPEGDIVVLLDNGHWHTLVFEGDGDHWESSIQRPADDDLAAMTPWAPLQGGWPCPNPDDPDGCYCPGDGPCGVLPDSSSPEEAMEAQLLEVTGADSAGYPTFSMTDVGRHMSHSSSAADPGAEGGVTHVPLPAMRADPRTWTVDLLPPLRNGGLVSGIRPMTALPATSVAAAHIHTDAPLVQIGWQGHRDGRVYRLDEDPAATEPGGFSPIYRHWGETCGHQMRKSDAPMSRATVRTSGDPQVAARDAAIRADLAASLGQTPAYHPCQHCPCCTDAQACTPGECPLVGCPCGSD